MLIPDFRGDRASIDAVVEARPDVLNHNLETVPRLYRQVRPGSVYKRSLEVLEHAKQQEPSLLTKTGIMVGLGEQEEEIAQLLSDCRRHNIDSFTAGQYVRPSLDHLPVLEYLSESKFNRIREMAVAAGFRHVAVGPLVRSSYHAEEIITVCNDLPTTT